MSLANNSKSSAKPRQEFSAKRASASLWLRHERHQLKPTLNYLSSCEPPA